MSKVFKFVQENIADKLAVMSENIILQAIRNGMMVTIPFTIIGSLFLILGSFPSVTWEAIILPYKGFLDVGYEFTFGMIAIIVVLSVAYNLGRNLDLNPLNSAVVAMITFTTIQVEPVEGGGFALSTANFGVTGIFTAIMIAILVPYIMALFQKMNLVIRLPGGVPSYVSDSFLSLLPAAFVILLAWAIRVFLGFDVNAIVAVIFSPLVDGLSTLPGILIMCFVVLLLWTCGLNGDSVLNGIYTPIMLAFLAENSLAFKTGAAIPHITADGFFHFGLWIGGTGATFALVLLMTRSKSQTYRSLSKVCLPAGTFTINEPLVFGFPIMFNPVVMIPYILTPLVLSAATYVLMNYNIIGRPVIAIPWTTPPLFSAFLVTGGDFRAVIWQAIEIVIAICIYYPFFKVAERTKVAEEKLAEEAALQGNSQEA